MRVVPRRTVVGDIDCYKSILCRPSRSEYDNLLFVRNGGHKEYLEDLKIGTLSVLYIKEMFLYSLKKLESQN